MLMAAKGIIGKLVGLSPQSTAWIYDAIIKPILLYGAVVWAHRIPRNFWPLIRLQRLAMLGMGHFLHSTPTLGLQDTLDFTPLVSHAREEASKAYVRILGRNSLCLSLIHI